jgi:hypothetical protein
LVTVLSTVNDIGTLIIDVNVVVTNCFIGLVTVEVNVFVKVINSFSV